MSYVYRRGELAHSHRLREREQAELVSQAWLEWRLNAAHRGASPDTMDVDPPAWFKYEELGFRPEHGPSLQWTMTALAAMNERAVAILGDDAPWRMGAMNDETRGPRTRRAKATPRGRRGVRGVAVTT